MTISIKVLKMKVSSEKETSEENYDEPNIEEKEDQDFLICFASEKVYGTIWEVQVQEKKMETK